MTKVQIKKETLLRFIEEKMECGGDSKEEISSTMKKLKKMSYKALKEWAVVHDFIDLEE